MNWRFNKMIVKRLGGSMPTPTLPLKTIFPCKDGQLCIALMGGGNPVFVNSCQNLVKWMDEKGMAPEWLKQVDWAVDYNASNLKADLLEKVNAAVEKFFLTVTKAEVFRQSIERKIIVAPINSTQDIVESEQLKARDFWVMMEHPELEDKLLYCGPFIKLSEAPITIRRRPPLVGEHNDEVYHHDLGMSREALVLLKQAAVI